jgi:hypothetical protein
MGENFGLFKSFGDRLFEGELPTNLGLIGSTALLDPDVTAYFARVTAAGGSLSLTEQDAIIEFVASLKAVSVWDSIKAIYPMVGSSAAACAQNLKSASFTGTFTSGWTFASTGATPNGTSAYMNPNLTSAANLSLNSAHIAFYSRTNNGVNAVMAGTQSLYVLARWTNYHANNSLESDLGGINTGTTSAGFFMSNRTIGTEMKYQINGAIQTDSVSTARNATIQSTDLLYMGAQNTTSFGVRLYNNYSTALYSLGDGLTNTQAADFYTSVQTFQTTLGRQIDPDATDFFSRVTAAGGSLTATEQTAVNNLVIDMKATGTWTGMKAIYPMVGGSAAACAQNLKSSSFTGTFSSGWTFSSLGITPNGISAFLNTNFIPSSQSINNNTHMSFYSRSNIQEPKTDMGIFKAADVRWSMEANYYSAGVSYGFASDQYNYSTGRASGANINSQGFYLGTRTNSTTHKGFKNSSQIGTTNTGVSGDITNIDANIYIGGTNAVGQPALYSSKQFAFASIGDGLTDTQATNLYNSVQTFQTTLSRQV